MSGLDVADGLPTGGGQVTLVCPLLAQSGHPKLHRTCPLLGVKRTWPFAGIRFRGRYWGQSGHGLLHCKCPLLTQSGHGASSILD
jgi:hypothetical protein